MGVISTFVNSWMFVPSMMILAAVGAVIFFKEVIDPEEDGIEEEALEEVVRGEVSDVVDLFGSEVKKKISYGITPIGKVNKAWGYKEYKALTDSENFDEDNDKYIKQDGEELKLDNNYFYFKIRPSGIIASIVAWVTDDILNFESHTDYIIVEKDFVADGEVITIKDEWNPTKMAGVWLPDNENSTEFVKGKTYESIFEKTMETTKEAVRSINNMNLQFTQDMQKLEKEEELLQKRYGSKAAGMVNEN